MSVGVWAVRGNLVLPGQEGVTPGVVVVEGERIVWAGENSAMVPDAVRGAAAGARPWDGYILPGLVDLHCHGGGGQSFPDAATPADALAAIMEHRRHGTTSLVASLVTDTPDVLLRQTGLLAKLAAAGELAGIHLEGPFLSPARCGAQDPTKMQAPSADLVRQVAQAGQGHFATMTLAPEVLGGAGAPPAGDEPVTQALAQVGAVPSFGHTDGSAGQMAWACAAARDALGRAARDGRARSLRPTVTHLFNGMRPVHHRDPGPVLEALAQAADGLVVVELIADGVHLDPDTVSEVFRLAAPGAVALVTDAMAAAGMADGSYQLGPMAVTVAGGVARLAGGNSIAGGTAHLIDVVRSALELAGVPLAQAVQAASLTPAQVLGIDAQVGSLAGGRRADLVLTDAGLHPVEVYRAGNLVT
ncbi:MAG: amidohydrolase family protein [Bifidobacteriaceae bacterium]|nr:amidohydrolase family protein [Bifidobacteriaceae bacterium]